MLWRKQLASPFLGISDYEEPWGAAGPTWHAKINTVEETYKGIRGTFFGDEQDEDESLSLGELLETTSGRWSVVLEVVATVFMLPFIYIGAWHSSASLF